MQQITELKRLLMRLGKTAQWNFSARPNRMSDNSPKSKKQ